MDLNMNLGEAIERVVNVENHSSEPACFHVYAMDFSVDRDGDFTFSEPGYESYSCTTWLTIREPDFDLSPDETKTVKVTISVPQEVEPGGHYAAVFVESAPPQPQPGVSVAIANRIPSLIYLTIPGTTDADIVTQAEIAAILLPGWVERGPVDVGVAVRNTGNVHLPIAAKAHFTDFRGGEIGELDLGQTIVLPGAERVLAATLEKLPFFGRVQTRVVIGYLDDNNEPVNKSTARSFQIIPWKVIMAVFVSLALIGIAIWRLRRKFRLRLPLERRRSEHSKRCTIKRNL
jgi:hypothetical protein